MATEYYEYRKNKFVRRSMQRIRQSFRESFRRSGSKDRGLSAAAKSTDPKPQQWHQDEATVRAGTCNFFVKYLGCVEVFESRGMQVCEEALKVLRAQRRRPVKAVLYTSGDGLRVVDAENKGLIVDQTIEKVSFCAPDRDHVKGFAYICRDGTTRRWMCHGFHAVKESGERLSHAVGCAFAVCLEKKQKRDRDAQTQSQLATLASSSSHALASSASVDSTPVHANGGTDNAGGVTNDTFTRAGSIRQASLVERLADPQQAKPAQPVPVKESGPLPSAVARPAANPDLFQRNGSLRMPTQSGPSFRRHQSLRMGDLPSTLQRQGQMGIPGARVSAIPEEGGLGIDLAALYATPQKGKLVHADTVTGLPPWDSAAHSQGGSVTSDSSNPSTSRSRAEAWLESTLQSARPGSLSPPNGASSPPPGTPPSLPAAVSPGVLGSDIFGQPAFAPAVPPRPPKLTKANTVDDPFEAKWAQLAKQPSPPPPTNPFRTHSTAVQL